MRNVNRTFIALLGALVLALAGLAPSATAATTGQTADTKLLCQYQIEHNKLSGNCNGDSQYGSLAGPFSGKVKVHGHGAGTMKLKLAGLARSTDGASGTLHGTFNGHSFCGGTAYGSFDVSLGVINISGTLVATSG